MVPPEIFIAWTKKTTEPILNLSILATLSYIGGLLSYYIGKFALKIEAVKIYLEVKMAEPAARDKSMEFFEDNKYLKDFIVIVSPIVKSMIKMARIKSIVDKFIITNSKAPCRHKHHFNIIKYLHIALTVCNILPFCIIIQA